MGSATKLSIVSALQLTVENKLRFPRFKSLWFSFFFLTKTAKEVESVQLGCYFRKTGHLPPSSHT